MTRLKAQLNGLYIAVSNVTEGSVTSDTRVENAQRDSAVTPLSGCFMLLQKRLGNTILLPFPNLQKTKVWEGMCNSVWIPR